MNNPEYLEKDFYAILGVAEDASAQDVKKAYRKLAQKLHPDANPGDRSAEERFKEVGRAYSVLSDPKKRAEYDEARRLVRAGGGFGGFPGGFGNSRVRVEDFGDLGDLGGLGGLFGNLFGGGRAQQRAARRGRDVESEVTLGFEEAVRGATIPLQLRGPAPCQTCKGTGAKPGTLPHPCPTCNGRGTVTRDQGLFGLSSPCPTCQGRGTVIDNPCPTCKGSGSEVRTRELRVRVPAGVNDGSTIKLKGQGEPGHAGAPAGDLIVKVRVTAHPLFGRRGQDLTLTVPVTFAEAALGTEVTVPTLDGQVTFKIPPGTQNGRTFRVKGRGVPGNGRSKPAGDLLLTVQVAVPEKLSRKERELLREFASLSDVSPRSHLGMDR
ncbi:MAG TPA: molecular chaperone DnaJ [Actinomycetes bacterium]|nr:molecular chaperone DnaJ [Actinomycetes bacterium]